MALFSPPSAPQLREEDRELIREVRHAAGNLVQRMQYWTLLLEDEAKSEPGAEAVVSLRASLGTLHRLVIRTLDLVRPTETQAISVPASDVARALATRFHLDYETAALDTLDLLGGKTQVDALVLDLAFALLDEVFVASAAGAPNVRSVLGIDVVSTDRSDSSRALLLSLRALRRGEPNSDPFADVHAHVTTALASKLLAACGCGLLVEENGETTVRVSVPLDRFTASDDARFMHSIGSHDSSDPFTL
jgi:hypothetical protein